VRLVIHSDGRYGGQMVGPEGKGKQDQAFEQILLPLSMSHRVFSVCIWPCVAYEIDSTSFWGNSFLWQQNRVVA